MSQAASKKQIILVAAAVAIVALGTASFYSQSEQKRPSYTIPEGYVKGDSIEKESEIIHEFNKPAPTKKIPTQSHEQSFERYLNALPAKERAEGVEFKTLFINRQNAKMYADYTTLMARASENKAKIAKNKLEGDEMESETEKNAEASVQIISQTAKTSPAELSTGNFESSENRKYDEDHVSMSDRLLETIVFRGTYKRRTSQHTTSNYGAIIMFNGKSKRVTSGQVLASDLKVLKVNEYSIVVKSKTQERTFSSEGGV